MGITRNLRLALLMPVAAIFSAWLIDIVLVNSADPATNFGFRIVIALWVSFAGTVVEFVAVPIAIARMWRYSEARTLGSYLSLAAGALPLVSLLLVVLAISHIG
jgi:hypothetical protein